MVVLFDCNRRIFFPFFLLDVYCAHQGSENICFRRSPNGANTVGAVKVMFMRKYAV